MTTHAEEGLLEAVLECPDDVGPRLVYADWLQEHGRPEAAWVREPLLGRGLRWGKRECRQRTAWVRACLGPCVPASYRVRLMTDESLLSQDLVSYVGDGWWQAPRNNLFLVVRHGFVEEVAGHPAWFARHAWKLFARQPVRHIRLVQFGPREANLSVLGVGRRPHHVWQLAYAGAWRVCFLPRDVFEALRGGTFLKFDWDVYCQLSYQTRLDAYLTGLPLRAYQERLDAHRDLDQALVATARRWVSNQPREGVTT